MRLKITHIDSKWFYHLKQDHSLTLSTRTTSVIFASIGSAASVYVLVAITGYLSFGNNVAGNIVGMCKS